MSYKEPLATTTDYGIVRVGAGLIVANGTVSYGVPFYGFFTDSTTQTNPVVNTANNMRFNTVNTASGITITGGNTIVLPIAGVWQVTVNGQAAKTDGGDDIVNVWLSQNGVNVPNSNTIVELVGTQNTGYRSAVFLVTTVAANETIQVKWSSPDLGMQFRATAAQVTPTRPASPSVRLVVSQI